MSHPTDPEYQQQVMAAAINAVLGVRPDDTGDGGEVDVINATQGLCQAIAMIAHKTGNFPTASLRRRWADDCRTEIIETMKTLAAAAECGEEVDWAVEPIDPRR